MIIWRQKQIQKHTYSLPPSSVLFNVNALATPRKYGLSIYTFLADYDKQIGGVWRDIPRPKEGLGVPAVSACGIQTGTKEQNGNWFRRATLIQIY